MWVPQIDMKKRGVYRSIVEQMRKDIETGILKPGDQLPPQRELSWALKVNLTTISRAYKEAVRQHLIGGEVGRGTYILANSAEASLFELHKDNACNIRPANPNAMEVVDLSTNIPARNIADNRFKTDTADILTNNHNTLFEEYHAPHLLNALKIAATKWMKWRNLNSKPENIILTGGAQTGLQAILIALCKSGDSILVEEYTFPGMKDFARQFGLKLIPIKMDNQGILPHDLNDIAQKNNAKFIILVPNHQNPTGAVMGDDRQMQIAKIITKHNLCLIEDDVYGGLSTQPPLASKLPKHAIYLTSFSKTVSFGLRVGFIHSCGIYLEALTHATNLTQWSLSPIMMQLTADWIENGTAFDKAEWQLSEIIERRKLADNILPKAHIMTTDKNSPHLWLKICCKAHIVKACEKANINIASATIFLPNNLLHSKTEQDICYIRISLVAPTTRQTLAIGLKRLATIISKPSQYGF